MFSPSRARSPSASVAPSQQQQQQKGVRRHGGDAVVRQLSVQITEQNRAKYGVLGPELLANLDDKLPKSQMSETDTGDRDALVARLTSPEYEMKWVNLSPYVDLSSISIPDTFSLERGYNLFRTMGLRHITVVDKHNAVIGVLSRKDLLPLHVEERLDGDVDNHQQHYQHEHDKPASSPSSSSQQQQQRSPTHAPHSRATGAILTRGSSSAETLDSSDTAINHGHVNSSSRPTSPYSPVLK